MTWCVPCYVSGKNAEAVGDDCLLYGCLSMLGPVGIYTNATIRLKIREKYGIGDKEGNAPFPVNISIILGIEP